MDYEFSTCIYCGIHFAIDREVSINWKILQKTFYCPNGHGVCYSESKSEVEEFKSEIKSLKDQLKAKDIEFEKQIAKVKELELDLEIWKPASKEK